jgi:hypothetical protein
MRFLVGFDWVRFARFGARRAFPDFFANRKNPRGDTTHRLAHLHPIGSIVRQFDAWRAPNPRPASKMHHFPGFFRKSFCARGVDLAHDTT